MKKSGSARRKKLDVDQLLTGVLSHLLHTSPYKLTFSRVSKITQVPRPTLYYYFGNSTKNLLSEAVKFGMRSFVKLQSLEHPSQHPDWRSFQKERLQQVIRLVKRRPWAPALYFQYRMNAGEWGEAIRDVENEYILKFSQAWKRYKGKMPDELAVRMSSYIKLGFFFGLAADAHLWFKPGNEAVVESLIDTMTDLVSDVMKLRFDSVSDEASVASPEI